VLKRKIIVGIAACSIMLTGCVSEQTYVGSEKPVANRSFDNIEAARTRISLGLNYLRRGDSSAAKYNLERARSFAPNSAEVYSALAYYYENVGEVDQAEEHYLIAIDKNPNYADAYNNYGAFLCQLQKYEASERLLLKAISRPGYIRVAESYENLALCQLQQNKFAKTKTYLHNSINHNSTRISSLVMAAGLSYAMGEMEQAKNQLARIQRLGRVSARTVLLSYLIADKTGDINTKNNAEQLLLSLYMGSAETTLLLQNKLALSEFELLRERYKETLMSNITLPTETAGTAITEPVANPKLKVVKRKTTTTDEAKTIELPSSSAVAAVVTTTAATLPAIQSKSSDIANSLVVSANKTEVLTTTKPQPLPVETVLKSQPSAVISAPVATADKTTAEPSMLAAADGVTASRQAEQETAAVKTVIKEPTKVAMNAIESVKTLPAELEVLTATESTHTTDIASTETDATSVDTASLDVTGDEVVSTHNAADESNYHLVQANDSLYAISMQYNIRLQRLMDWNQLTPESTIKTGQKIWLQPMPNQQLNDMTNQQIETRNQETTNEPYHQVVAGETMFAISYRYNIKLERFMAWNGLNEQSKLSIGQQVLVVDPALITP
jgi:type IV pilus assembly protein PilF